MYVSIDDNNEGALWFVARTGSWKQIIKATVAITEVQNDGRR